MVAKEHGKLNTPPFWYDLISVANVLSQIEATKADYRFLAVHLIKAKQDDNGMFTPNQGIKMPGLGL